jgi:hypothetical protein
MRAVAVSVWIFINLVFVGMCGYIYLLWSQYWQYVERQQEHMAGLISSGGSSGSSQIFYHNHDPLSSTTDPDVTALSSRNRSNDKTYTGCKYTVRLYEVPQKRSRIHIASFLFMV